MLPLFDIRPLRQQGACGISIALLDNNRRARDETDNKQNQDKDNKQEESEQQQQQDLSKLIPEAIASSVKEHGGDPTSLVLRFRFDNISNPVASSSTLTWKDKVLEILKVIFTASSSSLSSSIIKPRELKSFTLDLERCGVTDVVLGDLFEYLENDETQKGSILTHFFLAGNLITSKGLQKLLHVPDKCPPVTTETGKNLVHLGVTANPLGGHGLEVLSEYLEINPITNKLKILHATRIAWASQSSFAAMRAAQHQQNQNNHNHNSHDHDEKESNNNNSSTSSVATLPAPVAKPPGMITVYEAERFANAVKNAVNLGTVYFKQNAIQKSVDDEIAWPKSVILEDQ